MSKHLGVAEGVRDELGLDALGHEILERKFKDLFIRNGYDLVRTPTLEYADVFNVGKEENTSDLYTLNDRHGSLLALRSDMTASIARVLASHKEINDYPVSLAYVEKMYRSSRSYRGKAHEFVQAGIEYIGVDTIQADENILVLLSDALKEAGLNDYVIHLGISTFLPSLLKEWSLDEHQIKIIKHDIARNNYVLLRSDLMNIGIPSEKINILVDLMLSSGQSAFLDKVKSLVQSLETLNSIAYLEDLFQRLEINGLKEHVVIDFSLVAYAPYYTGIVFQAYTPNNGRNVAVGGRYNKFLGAFGRDLPAIGFAIQVEDLPLPIMAPAKKIFTIGRGEEAHKHNEALRQKGFIVMSSPFEDDESIQKYLSTHHFDEIINYNQK